MARKKERENVKGVYNRTATSARVVSARHGRGERALVKYVDFEPDERLNYGIEHGSPVESGKKTRGKKTDVKKPPHR